MAAAYPQQIHARSEPVNPDSGISLAQTAWEILRADVISGKLAPNARLRIAKLRDRYGIGASPLREALSRLVADGFVVSVDRRGFIVAPVSLKDFRDLTNLRKLLEKEALRLCLEKGDDAWEARVIAAFHRLSKVQARLAAREPTIFDQWETLNREFHESLVSACPSEWILRCRRVAYDYAERYRRVCLSSTAVSRNVQKEHEQLRDAALAHDIDRMHALIDDHLERTYRKVELSKKL